MIHILGNTRAVEIPTDSDLGDAIATLVRFIDVHNTMPHPASYSLAYDNTDRRWTLNAQQDSDSGKEADRIDTIHAWATALDGGVTRLGEPQQHQGSTRRQLSAHGTLAGHTQIEVCTYIAETHSS